MNTSLPLRRRDPLDAVAAGFICQEKSPLPLDRQLGRAGQGYLPACPSAVLGSQLEVALGKVLYEQLGVVAALGGSNLDNHRSTISNCSLRCLRSASLGHPRLWDFDRNVYQVTVHTSAQ